jgi:subtilisin family serine protease
MTDQTPTDRSAGVSRQDRAAAARSGKGTPPKTSTGSSRPGRPALRTRPERYLVAAVPPADVRAVASELEQEGAGRVIRILGERRNPGGYPGVAVIEMTAEYATRMAAHPGIRVEPAYPASTHPAQLPPAVMERVTFEVLDDGMHPIEGATINVTGGGASVTGYTGADGRAVITAASETVAAPAAIEIHPPRGCWPVRVRRPLLDTNSPMRVTCTRITTTHPEFPERALDSWGARVMGFGRLPPTYRGSGVRIALIGSGVATGHPDLSGRIEYGRDLTGRDEKGWQEDLVGTGTHHATLIAGCDDGTGIVGLAPEAEVHVCRVTPGGSVAELIDALDYCIEQRVDVVMIGAGIAEQSALLTAKVEEAWRAGIACIAAGPSAAGLNWPAVSPYMLTVGAVGQLGTFPPEGTDTVAVTSQLTAEGFFLPAPDSPAVDCCAPGVAIISGLPPSSYGPLSGSGSAAAHLTALAALILAHHPLFRREPGNPSTTADWARPALLLEIIKGSCRPLPQLDPARTGAGLPDAAVALGVAPSGVYPPLTLPYPAQVPVPGDRTPLEPLDAAMVAAGLITGDRPPKA